jgi:antitoxin CptB
MQDIAAERRKLCFRAWHRGTREADLILGPFADKAVEGWKADELALFADFLEENDPDIYDWLMDKATPPPRFAGLVKVIQEHIHG